MCDLYISNDHRDSHDDMPIKKIETFPLQDVNFLLARTVRRHLEEDLTLDPNHPGCVTTI